MYHSTSHIVDETDVRHIEDVRANVHDSSAGQTVYAIQLNTATSVFSTDPAVARKYFAALEAAAHELVIAANAALSPAAVAS